MSAIDAEAALLKAKGAEDGLQSRLQL